MTYKEYELFVKHYFEVHIGGNVTIEHQQDLPSADGSFNIDLSFTFRIGEMEYLTIIECKHSKNPIKRSVVMELDGRKKSLKAHKAIVVTTTGFQLGAVEYALKNGIGLIKLTTSGESEVLSHYNGNYDTYLKELIDVSIIKDAKLVSAIGIITPTETLEHYFMRKFDIDILPVLSKLDKPDILFGKNYLSNVPLDWQEEYEKQETAGLDLVLENENVIRMINALVRYYHVSQLG